METYAVCCLRVYVATAIFARFSGEVLRTSPSIRPFEFAHCRALRKAEAFLLAHIMASVHGSSAPCAGTSVRACTRAPPQVRQDHRDFCGSHCDQDHRVVLHGVELRDHQLQSPGSLVHPNIWIFEWPVQWGLWVREHSSSSSTFNHASFATDNNPLTHQAHCFVLHLFFLSFLRTFLDLVASCQVPAQYAKIASYLSVFKVHANTRIFARARTPLASSGISCEVFVCDDACEDRKIHLRA